MPTGTLTCATPVFDVRGLGRKELVADHIERDLAGAARGDGDRHGVAGPVFAACRARLRSMSGVSALASTYQPASKSTDVSGPFGSDVDDIEPVAAEIHRQRNSPGFVGRRVDRAVGDARRGLDRLEIPGAVALVILIMGIDPQQLVVQPALRDRRAVGRGDDDIEIGAGAVGERAAREQRLDADHVACGRHRQRDFALDRAAAGLRHAHRDLRFERMRARRRLVEIDRKLGVAGVVGRRQIVKRLLRRHRLHHRQGRTDSRQSRTALCAAAMVISPSRSRLAAGAP